MRNEPSRLSERGWREGYEAAIDDAVQVVDSLGGQSFGNLTSPVLMHLRERLVALGVEHRSVA